MIRAIMEAMARRVSRIPILAGRSMGHTVCVKSKEGVKDALSMTIPLGTGIHRRMVYVELKDGYKLADVAAAIKADDYFAHDETHVIEVLCRGSQQCRAWCQPHPKRRLWRDGKSEFPFPHGDKQSGPYRSGSRKLRTRCASSAPRLLHNDRDSAHRPSAW